MNAAQEDMLPFFEPEVVQGHYSRPWIGGVPHVCSFVGGAGRGGRDRECRSGGWQGRRIRAGGPHLYWGAKLNGARINPELLLALPVSNRSRAEPHERSRVP